MQSTIRNNKELKAELIFQGQYCNIRRFSAGILYMEFSDAYITENSLGMEGNQLQKLLSDAKPKLIFNASNLQPLDKAIRLKMDQLLSAHFSALAIVSATKMGKMVSTIFLTLSNSDLPKKYFESEDLAIAWLESCTGHLFAVHLSHFNTLSPLLINLPPSSISA